MTISAGTRLGPYEVLSPIGAGGMGEVWLARDPRLGREVAIKVLPEELAADHERLKRFEREARAASFVRAGIVASRPEGWAATVSTPGTSPLRGLGQALGPELSGDPEASRKLAGGEAEVAHEPPRRTRREGPGGWKIEVGPFPGWRDMPAW